MVITSFALKADKNLVEVPVTAVPVHATVPGVRIALTTIPRPDLRKVAESVVVTTPGLVVVHILELRLPVVMPVWMSIASVSKLPRTFWAFANPDVESVTPTEQ
jgi:hypothetical protein